MINNMLIEYDYDTDSKIFRLIDTKLSKMKRTDITTQKRSIIVNSMDFFKSYMNYDEILSGKFNPINEKSIYDSIFPSEINQKKNILESLYKDYKSSCFEEIIEGKYKSEFGSYCMYCGIGEYSSTLDHYYSRVDLPQYCFYYRNLIITCDICNKKKSANESINVQIENGCRNFVHPYIDIVPNYQYLSFCFDPSKSQYSFRIAKNEEDDSILSLIDRHYSNLDLYSRYAELVGNSITKDIIKIMNSNEHSQSTIHSKVTKYLLDIIKPYTNKDLDRNQNNPENVISRGILCDVNQFLNYIKSK